MALGYVIYIDGCLSDFGAFETEDEAADFLADNADPSDGAEYEIVEFE